MYTFSESKSMCYVSHSVIIQYIYMSISHRELVIIPFDFVVIINGSHVVGTAPCYLCWYPAVT
jgi:hypothetical protein